MNFWGDFNGKLFLVLLAAFLLRLFGIGYGLPLWVVADEPPAILGALKMMELGSLIPAFHSEEFRNILYFPPYLSYLYLIPFSLVLGFKFLFFWGTFTEFKSFIIADPSSLFLAARFISALFGVGTVWLTYKIGKNIFKKEAVGLLAAAFLALSFLHVDFSHWARHWVPVTFVFALVFYLLSRDDFSLKKKYISVALVAGLGVGINYQALLAAVFMAFWFFFYDRPPLKKIFREKWIYAPPVILIGLGFLAFLLNPPGLVVSSENITGQTRSFVGFLGGYGFYLEGLFKAEPALLLFLILGLVFSFFYKREYFLPVFGFILSYVAIFYFIFFHLDRYILMLYPVFAVSAGYGLYAVWEKAAGSFKPAVAILGALAFLIMLMGVLRLDFLLLKNDTRLQAASWIRAHVPKGAKIIVLARLARLPSLPQAIAEQEALDPDSLRKIDEAERTLPSRFLPEKRYHALNLYTVKAGKFFENPGAYLESRGYEYLVLSPEFAELRGADDYFQNTGETLETFEGFRQNEDDVTNGFGGGLKKIFERENNGPTMVIKKIE